MGVNLKVVWAEFSTFNLTVFVMNVIARSHFELKTWPDMVLLACLSVTIQNTLFYWELDSLTSQDRTGAHPRSPPPEWFYILSLEIASCPNHVETLL
jgi:hypothetical protein